MILHSTGVYELSYSVLGMIALNSHIISFFHINFHSIAPSNFN